MGNYCHRAQTNHTEYLLKVLHNLTSNDIKSNMQFLVIQSILQAKRYKTQTWIVKEKTAIQKHGKGLKDLLLSSLRHSIVVKTLHVYVTGQN